VFYPYAMFGAGLLLGWRFRRSRLLFALLLLTLVDRAVLHVAIPKVLGRQDVVFQAAAFRALTPVPSMTMAGPRGGSERYCWYLSASSASTSTNSAPVRTIRAVPSTRTHHRRDQSSSYRSARSDTRGSATMFFKRCRSRVRFGF